MSPGPVVLVAIPRRQPLFAQLWSPHAAQLAADGGLQLRFLEEDPADRAAWQAALHGCEAAVTSWGAPSFDTDLLAGNERLQVIAHAAGSVADLVTPAVYDRGIQVISANEAMAAGVAEWCLTMSLIGFSRLLTVADLPTSASTPAMHWPARHGFRTLRNARIGIWGYGAVARAYIALLRPLQPRGIAVCADHPCADELTAAGLESLSLDELCATCDVIVLAAGLTAATCERCDTSVLARIRDGATLINCGRARLIPESALLAAAQSGRFTLCLDVFHQEPLPADHPLHRCPNVIMTPHVAGLSTMGAFIPAVLAPLTGFFAGQPLSGAISRERALAMTSHTLAHQS